MPKLLSSRWLMLMVLLTTLLAALKPALIAHVMMVMGILLIGIWRDERGAFARINPLSGLLLGLVLVWAIASVQWSLLPVRAMYDLIVLLVLAGLMLQLPAAMPHITTDDNDRLLRLLIATAMVAILIFIMDVGIDLIWQRTLAGESWGALKYSLAVISRSGLCILLLLWPIIAYSWRREWHLLGFFLWVIVGVSFLFTDSASGRLAFAASTVIFVMASYWPKFTRILLMTALAAGFLLAVPLAKVTQNFVQESNIRLNNSFMHRTEIWRFSAERIQEKPVLGWGFDSARAISNMGEISIFQGFDPMKSIIPMHPHNWMLHALLELGVIGGAILTTFWLWLLYLTSQLHRRVQATALAGFSIAIVVGAFSIGIWQSWWLSVLIFFALILQLMDHEARRAG